MRGVIPFGPFLAIGIMVSAFIGEKIFNMYKFRTMTDERDENGNLLPDNIRLTTFGKLLRKTITKS